MSNALEGWAEAVMLAVSGESVVPPPTQVEDALATQVWSILSWLLPSSECKRFGIPCTIAHEAVLVGRIVKVRVVAGAGLFVFFPNVLMVKDPSAMRDLV